MTLATASLASALGIAAAMLALWLLSLRLRDASIVDIFWGAGFAGVGLGCALAGDGFATRRLLVGGLAALWGLRLAFYLFQRNHGNGEDPRYQSMRRRNSDNFAVWSLINVFALQGALMWFISLPLQVTATAATPTALGVLDVLGLVFFAIGLGFEAVGDAQLARFKADPANAGKVMDQGLWAWTRHPNYFGDACVWWGFYCFALATGAWWAVVSPIVMTFFLTRVSGVPILERRMARTRPGYAEYAARTSGFFPLPPRR